MFIVTFAVILQAISATDQIFQSPCIKILTHETFMEAFNSQLCLYVVVGAAWDGHFKNWARRGYWERVANLYCDSSKITFGFMQYIGPFDLPYVMNTSSGYALWKYPGSYDVRAFRNKVLLTQTDELRDPFQLDGVPDSEVAKRISSMCDRDLPEQPREAQREL